MEKLIEVIELFKRAEKMNAKFLKLDIESYYQSINPSLLNKALDFAKEFSSIKDVEITVILNA